MKRHPYIVDVLRELICRPFFFGKVEFTNRLTVEGSLISLDDSVVAVDSHRAIIVRD